MPCDDISEVIDIRLDVDECLESYQLNKRTCGAQIGNENLLYELFRGQRPEEILEFPSHNLRAAMPEMQDDDEFLYYKHLFALQLALEVLIGREAGARTEPCALASVSHDPYGLTFRGIISIDAVSRKIKACGHCGGGCKTRSKQPSRTTIG